MHGLDRKKNIHERYKYWQSKITALCGRSNWDSQQKKNDWDIKNQIGSHLLIFAKLVFRQKMFTLCSEFEWPANEISIKQCGTRTRTKGGGGKKKINKKEWEEDGFDSKHVFFVVRRRREKNGSSARCTRSKCISLRSYTRRGGGDNTIGWDAWRECGGGEGAEQTYWQTDRRIEMEPARSISSVNQCLSLSPPCSQPKLFFSLWLCLIIARGGSFKIRAGVDLES